MEQIKFVIFILADYSDTHNFINKKIFLSFPFFQFMLLKINTVLSSNSLLTYIVSDS